MRIEFFDPVEGPRFRIESRIVNRRGRTLLVEVSFRDLEGRMLLFSTAMLIEQPIAPGAPTP